MGERVEAILRIPIGIISGIILGIWKVLVHFVTIIHWIYVLITGKRSRGMADFCNRWITFAYTFLRYMTFSTNKRPFPFAPFPKDIQRTDFKRFKFFR